MNGALILCDLNGFLELLSHRGLSHKIIESTGLASVGKDVTHVSCLEVTVVDSLSGSVTVLYL